MGRPAVSVAGKGQRVPFVRCDLVRVLGRECQSGQQLLSNALHGIGIEARLVEREVDEAALTVGDPLEWTTETGPMVSEDQFDTVCELVDDALENGAERLTGGPREVPGFPGKFIAPTVLTDVDHSMQVMRDEIHIPTIPAYFMIDNTTGYVRLQDFSENTNEELGHALKDLNGKGMRRLLLDPFEAAEGDLARGGGEVFDACFAALAPFGRLVTYGIASGKGNEVHTRKLMGRSRAVIGFWLMHCLGKPAMIDEALRDLYERAASGELRAVVGATYPLSEARQAQIDLAERRTTGKVLLDPSG